MPQFQRKSFPFTCKGMSIARPIDQIPLDEYAYLKNIRAYKLGQLQARPGLTLVSNDFTPGVGTDYIHSGYTLNDQHPDTTGTSLRFAGFNDELWTGPLTNPATFQQADTGFSGNPLSMVAMNPDGAPTPWLYVADSLKMRKYSATFLTGVGGTPIPHTIGLAPPTVKPSVAAAAGAGALTGTYYYRYRYRHPATGAKSNPGPIHGYGTGGEIEGYEGLALTAQNAQMTLPAYSAGFVIDVFRWGGAVKDWRWVGSGDGGDVFVDSMTDVEALASETLDFDCYQPFPTEDIPRTGTCTTAAASVAASGSDLVIDAVDNTKVTSASYTFVAGDIGKTLHITAGTGFTAGAYQISGVAAGVATLGAACGTTGSTGGGWRMGAPNGTGSTATQTGGDGFNADWEPGGIIFIANVPYTLKRYVSPNVWELVEDAGVQVNASFRLDGARILGQPVSHLWGPWGSGEAGVVMFACGDPRRPGHLLWTNGNDPDTTSPVNALEITSPSEPLVNGCIYDGRCFVWSAERMFAVYPAGNGQFHAQVVPGAKGLYAPWGLYVGEHIFFISKDGIYATNGGIPTCITDEQLYPIFPHDGQPGVEVVRGADTLKPPDPNQRAYWRLCYGDGFLYFDFTESATPPNVGAAKTWVYDSRVAKGWFLDDYQFDGATSRWWEESYHSLLVGIGAVLYLFDGVSDGGFDIACQVQSGAWDCGDPRAKKLIGDCLVTLNPNAAGGPPAVPTVTVKLLGENNTTTLATGTTNAGVWTQLLIDVNSGIGTLSRTLGIDITWAAKASTPELFEWHPSWVPKPETSGKRATDWTNDGQATAKWVRGCVIEGDISTVAAADLVVDGANPLTVTSAAHAFVAGDVGAVLAVTSGAGWTVGEYEVVSVAAGAAVLDRSPAPVTTTAGSYTLGGVRTVQVQSDGAVLRATITVSHPGQTEHAYSFAPFVAHEMRLVPTDTATWQEFGVRWLWDPYPEYLGDVPDFDDGGYPGWKYVRGVVITGDTQGVAVQVQAQYDGSTVAGTLTLTQTGRSQATFAFATPFLAQLLRIVPLGKWRKFSVRWIYDEQPDFGELLTPWMPSGSAASNLLRGVILPVDTANAQVLFDVQGDGGTVLYANLSVTANGQTGVPVYFAVPKVTHFVRLVPKSSWRLWMPVQWVSDPWPELTRFVTPWSDAGHLGAKHVRGLKMKADSTNAAVQVQVQRETGAVIATLTAQHNGPEVKPYPITPVVANLLRLVPLGDIRIWDAELEWVRDIYPELTTFTTEWWNGEYPYAKFVQGCRLTADTGGVPVQVQIQYDGGTAGPLLTCNHNGLQTLPYSWTPFVGHNFRLVPLGNIRIFKEPSWVWEPIPEAATEWQTQETNHDIPGWHHLRDGYVAHMSPAPITLRIAYEGATVDYAIAASGGLTTYARPYIEFQHMKARARSYRLFSAAPFRLFVKDTEVRVRGWGADGPYQIVRPFGDVHREAGARI
ncbi:MAG: hypothetical protein LLG45_09060 [Actinomycetia bacterium]|nr:hypothetical protein [Actinomycetes bacterium]